MDTPCSPPGLTKGRSFSSFKELEPLLEELKKLQFVPFKCYCTIPVQTYNKKHGKNLPDVLRYQSFTYACIHYGTRREKSTGVRPNQSSLKMGCKARLRIRVDESIMKLVVTEMDLIHNHEQSPSTAKHYSDNRQLTAEEGGHVVALMDLEVRPVLLQSIIRTTTQKLTTLQDLRNLQQRLNKNKSTKLIGDSEAEKLIQELKNTQLDDPNCAIVVGKQDNNGDIAFIFWASSQMKADFEMFPEVISVDTTYHVNNSEMPLTLFLNQNKHGNGRLVGVCLMKDEKKETLRESIDCFIQCYSSSAHKISTFFVDKSLNEISRIWELLPNVDIHLCRFHCDRIFKRETKSEPELVQVRAHLKAMLYTSTEEEYEHYFSELKKVCSNTFRDYFQKNWHSSRVIWKGHDRLKGITFGLTTTNPNESLHGKLKTLLNRKRTITNCFQKLRQFHNHYNVQAAQKDFDNRMKVKYVTNNTDQAIGEITATCTSFVAELIRFQLRCSYEMEALPAGYSINCDRCECSFYRSRNFPCCHMFFSRRIRELPLFSKDDVPTKWHINCIRQKETTNGQNENEEENVDDDFEEVPHHPPPVLIPSLPVKVGGKPLTNSQKYSKFLELCERAGRLASLHGGAQFVRKCNVIESIIEHWENNTEVCVTPLVSSSSERVMASHETVSAGRPSVIVHQKKPDSSVATVGVHINERVGVPINESEFIVEDSNTISPENAPEKSGESSPLLCRCGLQALEYRSLFGPNSGKICFRCPKKLPDVPCTFSTVKTTDVTTRTGTFGSKKPNGNLKKPSGIVKIPLSELSEIDQQNLQLPKPKKVIGQPKMGVQRSFKKSTKPWTIPNGDFINDRDQRRKKGSEIPDSAVEFRGNETWQVKSQSSSSTCYEIRKTKGTSDTCFCDNSSRCVHCFSCDCPDYRIRSKVCKHIFKVQQVYVQSLLDDAGDDDNHSDEDADGGFLDGNNDVTSDNPGDEDAVGGFLDEEDADVGFLDGNNNVTSDNPGDEDAVGGFSDGSNYVTTSYASEKLPEKSHEGEQEDITDQDLLDLVDALAQDEIINGSRECQVCTDQGKPTILSAHKCAKCFRPVHLFGCSTENPGSTAEEGHGGSDRICWSCYDELKETNANMSNNNPISPQVEPENYICFGCNNPRVKRVSKNNPKTRGRAFYACPNPVTAACRAFFWAPTRATIDPTTKKSGQPFEPQSNVIQNYFGTAAPRCNVCCTELFIFDEKVTCCSCAKQVHFDQCSFAQSGTKEQRLCKNCFCLLCRTQRAEGHTCSCCVCEVIVNAADDMLCYRCERIAHERCSKQIRAAEIGNQLRYICNHCFAAMATGVSDSIRSDIRGNKLLSDEHMARASAILSAQFTAIDGLCAPLAVTFGSKVDNSNYYPTRTKKADYVQIMNTGRKHWVTAIFKTGSQDVIVLDSSRNLAISGHTKIQLAMIAKSKENSFKVIRPPCKQQNNARDCGLFAIAFAVDYCLHKCSDYVDYNPSAMRFHLLNCLEAGSFTAFPRLNASRQKKIKELSLSETVEISCTCRLPSNFDDEMVVCDRCGQWFHVSCVGLDKDDMPEDWFCSDDCSRSTECLAV
ncbi:Protein FAR-RED IMPAIRED RESPONSE 1 [Frankliniella fusca]|uniref:Protein FAR-RED IMPAIRED RESPONSE 1 n=1 Tax=Frankliniella fusca TaxID=407009 RepID=A0AAE1HZ64_9NEOP|nr:Protein FAR-RED IMPAIRED RESPONSE 1 [Frankliniella fusca]